MKSIPLALAFLCFAQTAQALQFPCQNPSGRSRADNVAVITREMFMGEQQIVVHFPDKVDGRDFFYSKFTVGNSRIGQAVVEARPYPRPYGNSRDWHAIYVEHQLKKLPLMLTIYYGANLKCRTTVQVPIQ